jgi:hypothetical protein
MKGKARTRCLEVNEMKREPPGCKGRSKRPDAEEFVSAGRLCFFDLKLVSVRWGDARGIFL